jgi:hypothetical protein
MKEAEMKRTDSLQVQTCFSPQNTCLRGQTTTEWWWEDEAFPSIATDKGRGLVDASSKIKRKHLITNNDQGVNLQVGEEL